MHPAAALLQDDSAAPPAATARKAVSVRFSPEVQERDHFDSPVDFSSSSSDDDAASFSDDESLESVGPAEYAPGVLRDEASWAGNLPAAQGLVGAGYLM